MPSGRVFSELEAIASCEVACQIRFHFENWNTLHDRTAKYEYTENLSNMHIPDSPRAKNGQIQKPVSWNIPPDHQPNHASRYDVVENKGAAKCTKRLGPTDAYMSGGTNFLESSSCLEFTKLFVTECDGHIWSSSGRDPSGTGRVRSLNSGTLRPA